MKWEVARVIHPASFCWRQYEDRTVGNRLLLSLEVRELRSGCKNKGEKAVDKQAKVDRQIEQMAEQIRCKLTVRVQDKKSYLAAVLL